MTKERPSEEPPMPAAAELAGRFDVHSHLLPGVDDGCETVEESVQCARRMVAAGYTHSFCTPHVWPDLPHNSASMVPVMVRRLQAALDDAGVPLRLYPGGEINLRESTRRTPPDELVTYAMARQFVLMDFWNDPLPPFFEPSVAFFHSFGTKVILAHPERMRPVQADPSLADRFAEMGVLLQGNLQCFSDPPGAPTRRTAERYLAEGRYFLLGSDLHRLNSLQARLDGLDRAIELAGADRIRALTVVNPRKLLPVT
jgi:protein-tyrosine phosphatase